MIKITCTSFLGDLDFETYSSTTINRLKMRISGKTYIDEACYRLGFMGKPLLLHTKISEIEDLLLDGAKIKIDFNKTDYAREQVTRYAKKNGLEIQQSHLSLKDQLAIQEEQFEKEEIPGFEVNVVEEAEPKDKKTRFKNMFKKDTTSAKAIRKQRVKERAKVIDKALETAYAVIPEFYTDCGLAFVEAKINGVSVKACIDSGAGRTVMLMETAQKCGIFNLIDGRYAGNVIGVGSSRMLGRVNHTSFEMGEFKGNFHVSVITSGSTELLLGLDFLRFYGVNVNVAKNCLEFKTGEIVEFVPFHKRPEAVKPAPVLDSLLAAFGGGMNINM